MATTSNMGLPIDVVSVTPGPGWATDLEQTKLLIDAHTHVSGYGVPVPTAGLNINASIPMGGFGLSSAGLMGLSNQLTTTTGLNISGFGGIAGLAGTTGAWTYSAALTTFIGTADTNKSAAVDAGAVTIRETNVANAKGVRLKTTTGLAADYDLTFPSALAATSGVMGIDSTGQIATGKLSVSGLMPCNQFYVYGEWASKTVPIGGFHTMFANRVVKDTASAYNQAQGIYTIPADGDWVFGWEMPGNVTTGSGGFLQSQLMVNSGAPTAYGASSKIWAGGSQGFTGIAHSLPGTFLYMNAKVGDRAKVGIWWDEAGSHTAGQSAAVLLTSGSNYFYGYQLR